MYSETAVSVGTSMLAFIFAYLSVHRQQNDALKFAYLMISFTTMYVLTYILSEHARIDGQTTIQNMMLSMGYILLTIVSILLIYYFVILLINAVNWAFKKKGQDDGAI